MYIVSSLFQMWLMQEMAKIEHVSYSVEYQQCSRKQVTFISSMEDKGFVANSRQTDKHLTVNIR